MTAPFCRCGNAAPGPWTPDQCWPCWAAANASPDAGAFAAAAGDRPPPPEPARPPCPHLGAVVEACVTCGGRAAEMRNVHACEHPEHGGDLGPNRDGKVTRGGTCQHCPHHPDAAR